MDGPHWTGTRFTEMKIEAGYSKNFMGDVLIPVILSGERQVYLLHVQISLDRVYVESYVASKYESEHTSQEDDAFADLDLP